MAMEEELWKSVTNDIGRELGEYYLLDIDSDKKVARLYDRRSGIGAPIKLVDGKWPVPGTEDIVIDGKGKKITVYKHGIDYIPINEKIKEVLSKNVGGFLAREFDDKTYRRSGIEYYFSVEPIWPG